jgi:lipopolysaccharide export system protein LptC
MVRGDGVYSRVIAWLKILLPLAALALLSTLFLLSRSREPLEALPFVEALQEGAARQQMTAPYFAGTTTEGDVVTMTARSARPDGGGQILADDLEARLRLSDGSEITLDAATATLRDKDQQAHLSGGVQIQSSQGYSLTTDDVISRFDDISAESLGPVQGQGPVGTFEAGHLRIAPTGDDGAMQMVFSGGVKLIYRPPDRESVAE